MVTVTMVTTLLVPDKVMSRLLSEPRCSRVSPCVSLLCT